jgi:hypothetical protein
MARQRQANIELVKRQQELGARGKSHGRAGAQAVEASQVPGRGRPRPRALLASDDEDARQPTVEAEEDLHGAEANR